jgi:hypothetical protein
MRSGAHGDRTEPDTVVRAASLTDRFHQVCPRRYDSRGPRA